MLLLLALTAAHARPSATIALTFDDLPYQTLDGRPTVDDPAKRSSITTAILGHLGKTPAAVFVNCGQLHEDEILPERWGAAGHAVANHGAHHTPIGDTITVGPSGADSTAFAAEVASCDQRLRSVRGYVPWFRYPYLREGASVEVRDAGFAALASAGLQNVPVTVPTSEWIFSAAYDRAKTAKEKDEIASAYVDHMVDAIRLARQVAEDRVGRDVPQLVLLHVNQLEADQLGLLLSRLKAEDVKIVSPAKALKDEVYARPDTYVGDASLSWLYRIDPPMPDGGNAFGELEDEVAAKFAPRSGVRYTWTVSAEHRAELEAEVRRRLVPLHASVTVSGESDLVQFEIVTDAKDAVRRVLRGPAPLMWYVAVDLPDAVAVDDPRTGLQVQRGTVLKSNLLKDPVTSARALRGPVDVLGGAFEGHVPEGHRVLVEVEGDDAAVAFLASATPAAETLVEGVDLLDNGVRLRFEPSAAATVQELTTAQLGQTLVVVVGSSAVLHVGVREPISGGRLVLGTASRHDAEVLEATLAPWPAWAMAPLAVEQF